MPAIVFASALVTWARKYFTSSSRPSCQLCSLFPPLSLFLFSLSSLFLFSLFFSQLIFAFIDDIRLIWVQVQHLHFIINDFENGLNAYPGYSTSPIPLLLLSHSFLMMPLGRQSINRCKFMGIKLPHNE